MSRTLPLLTLAALASALAAQTPITLVVTVPDAADEVYVSGDQPVLGDWNPAAVEMTCISPRERAVSLPLQLPATFKFTRGDWDAEGITAHFYDNPKLVLEAAADTVRYEIKAWSDAVTHDEYRVPYAVVRHESALFRDERTVAVALPDGYDPARRYPVVYVLDGASLFKPVLLHVELLAGKSAGEDDFGLANLQPSLKHLFGDYKTYDVFCAAAAADDFSMVDYAARYETTMRRYGDGIVLTEEDIFSFVELAAAQRDARPVRQVTAFAKTRDDLALRPHYRFYYAGEVGDRDAADAALREISASDDIVDQRLVY